MRVRLILLGCLALGALVACGRKGPLYLPDKAGAVVTRPGGAATPAPVPDSTTEESSSEEEDEKPK